MFASAAMAGAAWLEGWAEAVFYDSFMGSGSPSVKLGWMRVGAGIDGLGNWGGQHGNNQR